MWAGKRKVLGGSGGGGPHPRLSRRTELGLGRQGDDIVFLESARYSILVRSVGTKNLALV